MRKLLQRRARLRRDVLDDKKGAAVDLKKLHDLSPSDLDVMNELSALLLELGDHRGMIQLYEDQILRGRDPAQRAELARKVARLWEEELADAREAADAWRRVLRMKAGDTEATAGLDRAKSGKLKRPPPRIAPVPARAPSTRPPAAAHEAPGTPSSPPPAVAAAPVAHEGADATPHAAEHQDVEHAEHVGPAPHGFAEAAPHVPSTEPSGELSGANHADPHAPFAPAEPAAHPDARAAGRAPRRRGSRIRRRSARRARADR